MFRNILYPMTQFKQLLLALLICTPFLSWSQAEIRVTDPGVSINDNGNNTPDPNAVLHINSENKGVMFPHLDTDTRNAISDPSPGLLIFNSDHCVYEYFNGSSWQPMGVIPVKDVPNSPSNLVASISGSNSITLNWSDNSDNESGFEIWHQVGDSGFSFLTTMNKNNTSHVHSNLSEGIHSYQIRSINGCAKGLFSNTSNSVLIIDLDGTYMSLTIRGDEAMNFNLSNSEVLSWKDVSGNNRYMSKWVSSAKYPTNTGTIGLRKSIDFNGSGTIVTPNPTDYDFLHQGNLDFTMLWVCEISDRPGSGYNNNLASSQHQGSTTGINVVTTASDLNNSQEASSFVVNIKSPASIVHFTTGAQTIDFDKVNVFIVRYEASTKTFHLDLKNGNHRIEKSQSFNVNFNQSSSSLPYRIGTHNSGGFWDEISEHHIWMSKLSDTDVDKILDLFYEYYK